MNFIATIDGPTASGKSTLGFNVANRLGFQFVDSGSIYRAGCLYLLKNGFPTENDELNSAIFRDLDLSFQTDSQRQRVFLAGEEVTKELYTSLVTSIVPIVGGKKLVREVVREKQRELVEQKDTVIVGRDLGSEVFPQAPARVYVTARPEVRAYRRLLQLQREEGLESPDFNAILQALVGRDFTDSNREISPMRKPEGSFTLDTSDINMERSADLLYDHVSAVRFERG